MSVHGEFKEIKDFVCWECNHPLNVSASMTTPDKRPHYRAGDVAMCGYCGALHMVDANLDAVKPPAGFMEFLKMVNPAKYEKLLDFQRMTRDKMQKGTMIQIPGNHCLKCGELNDGNTPANSDRAPKPGMMAVCFYCGNLHVFDANMKLTQATDEILELVRKVDPKAHSMIMAMHHKFSRTNDSDKTN